MESISAIVIVEGAEKFIGKSDKDALALLEKPTIVHLKGKSKERAVLVSVMLHGSEPCGFRAFLAEINKNRAYPFDVYFLIGNVRAAKIKPEFSNRFIPGDVNYNRIWSDKTEHPVALQAKEFFDKIPLSAVLDIHSFTTKKQIPHCFITSDKSETLKMAKMLAPYVLISKVSQGTLIEHFGKKVPACTVECGTNNSKEADAYAIETLERVFRQVGIVDGENNSLCRGIYNNEIHVKINANVKVCWADSRQKGFDVTIRADCEKLNLTEVKEGTVLGWTDSLQHFRVVHGGREIGPKSIFKLVDGEIRFARDCVPTLISTSEMIVKESGFYLFEKYVKS